MTDDWQGFQEPRYTPVPDEVFDYWLDKLTGSQLRVLLYIIRRTFGFKKDADVITLEQMSEGIVTKDGVRLDAGTGLHKVTCSKACSVLAELGLIVIQENWSGDERLPNTYSLKMAPRALVAAEEEGVYEDAEESGEVLASGLRGISLQAKGVLASGLRGISLQAKEQQTVIQQTDNNNLEGEGSEPEPQSPPKDELDEMFDAIAEGSFGVTDKSLYGPIAPRVGLLRKSFLEFFPEHRAEDLRAFYGWYRSTKQVSAPAAPDKLLSHYAEFIQQRSGGGVGHNRLKEYVPEEVELADNDEVIKSLEEMQERMRQLVADNRRKGHD